jgi:uncharacterized protein YhfF
MRERLEACGDAYPGEIRSTPPELPAQESSRVSILTDGRRRGEKVDEVAVGAYWRAYLATLPNDSPVRDESYEAWSFGDGPAMADKLGALVLAGQKAATCSAFWELEAEGEAVARSGEKSIVLGGSGEPLCIVETTEVTVRRFDEMDEAFARDEGEGDRSLEYWRGAHRNFFARTLPEIGRRFTEDMPLVCERFRVVYR